MLRHVVPGLVLCALLGPAAMPAQEPQNEAGAFAAVVALLRHRPEASDSMRFAPDSATMFREFVRCQPGGGSATVCSLVSDKPVIMVRVQLRSPTTAAVEVRYYQMMRAPCPIGPRYDAPVIDFARKESLTLGYADGHWKPTGRWTVVEC